MTFAKTLPGFEAAVRDYIVSTIGISHDLVSKQFVKEQLNLGEKEAEVLVSSHGWTAKNSDFVVKLNSENQMRPKKFKEDIDFADMQDIIQVLSR